VDSGAFTVDRLRIACETADCWLKPTATRSFGPKAHKGDSSAHRRVRKGAVGMRKRYTEEQISLSAGPAGSWAYIDRSCATSRSVLRRRNSGPG